MSTRFVIDPSESFILIVEDNEHVRDILQLRLENRGFNVMGAFNGVDALEKMRQHTFHLILLDIMMPEMNGYQVLEHMKEDDNLSDIPVVVLSALNDMDSIVRCVDLGAEDYLFKPINSSLLWSRINASLEKKHLRDQEKAAFAENSILQQIDRDLNISLDLDHVAEMTLSWAMRQLNTIAGQLIMVDDDVVMMLAAAGVSRQVVYTPADMQAILEKGEIQQMTHEMGTGLHIETTNRVTVPVYRRSQTGALLILEYQKALETKQVKFLSKLADHAAVALINAQLHTAVQAADRAKSDFVSLVSHELKTPMTSIDGYAALMASGATGQISEQQDKFLTIIRANVSRMKTIVSDLTDISRIETGQLHITPQEVVVADVIAEVMRTMERQVAEKRQHVDIKVPDDLPTVHADHDRFVQIMNNLLSNACKYTPEEENITIQSLVQPEGMVQIAVADSGIGIAEEEQTKIFSQFFRSSDKLARSVPGTGLGLNITQKLVRLQGGDIWFKSVYREGTTFYFTLPIYPEAA